MCWCFPPHPFQSPQDSGGTIAGRSSARDDRAGPGPGEGLPRPASVRAGRSRSACRSLAGQKFGTSLQAVPVAAQGSSRSGPGRQGRVVSDRPSLLQGFHPVHSYCADARAFCACKPGQTRERVRGRLPARLVMSRLGAPRREGFSGEGCAGCAREGGRDRAREGGRALARGQARARQGGRGLPVTKRRLPRGCYSAVGRILRCDVTRLRIAPAYGPAVTGAGD